MLLNNFKLVTNRGGYTIKGTHGQDLNASPTSDTFKINKIDNYPTYTNNHFNNNYNNTEANENGNNYFGLVLGTGTTPVTSADYQLNTKDTSLTFVSGAISTTADVITITENWINNTANDITITEIGVGYTNNTSSSYYTSIMIGREVLATPITVPAGKTGVFSYTIDYTNIIAG